MPPAKKNPKISELGRHQPITTTTNRQSVVAKATGMLAGTCPHLARVGEMSTIYKQLAMSIIPSGLEGVLPASQPR